MTRIYRELNKLNSQNINDPMKKWTNELNRPFSKEEVQMAKKHMKKYSPSLAIKEMQIKITPTIKNTTKNVGQDVGGKEPSYTAGRNIN
jgi:hypothetical protein